MQEYVTFDDVLIKPKMSFIDSRRSVSLRSELLGTSLRLPIFSSNMDTVTGSEMCGAMHTGGGMGVLHRFCSINSNVEMWKRNGGAVSVGIGEKELERAIALNQAGAKIIFIDVAHGASYGVAAQLKEIKKYTDAFVVVGNFASADSIQEFLKLTHVSMNVEPDAFKIGIGPGSACTTRIKTGIGMPQLSAIMECAKVSSIPVIADGGMKTAGDIAKAFAAGAKAVMLGGMLAGTDETPGEVIHSSDVDGNLIRFKSYRGSASKESYAVQNKNADWRTDEGEAFTVPYKGSVVSVLKDIEGGLRSSFTYVGAMNLEEFQANADFIKISSSTRHENGAHGKSK